MASAVFHSKLMSLSLQFDYLFTSTQVNNGVQLQRVQLYISRPSIASWRRKNHEYFHCYLSTALTHDQQVAAVFWKKNQLSTCIIVDTACMIDAIYRYAACGIEFYNICMTGTSNIINSLPWTVSSKLKSGCVVAQFNALDFRSYRVTWAEPGTSLFCLRLPTWLHD
jgi:hypothetical protein